jgi:pyruvate dehydrogenase E2 component (dihydrolipoamide acetyltransferase)
MPHPILMPRPGQMTEECTLLAWRKNEGDRVEKGDVLFEIETDKAVMEVEAFEAGTLLRRIVDEGQTVPVNSVCAYVGEPGEAIPETAIAEPAGEIEAAGASPQDSSSPPSMAPAPEGADDAAPVDRAPRPPMSPRARRRAAQVGVDPLTVQGSGPHGRIVARDVEAAHAAAKGLQSAYVAPGRPSGDGRDGEDEPVPLSRIRQAIAARLRESASVPVFTVTMPADVSKLMQLRAELQSAGTPLTITDFVMMACARALVEMPAVNSRTDGHFVWLRRQVHLGVAVSASSGLVVPVIRDADHLTPWEIHARAAGLIGAARQGTLAPDDMTGSTFTISNLGMFGVEEFTALINPGESAILAVGRATPTSVVIDGGIGIRTLMRMTLAADHRLIDGELAARFLDAIRRRLENPGSLARRTIEI